MICSKCGNDHPDNTPCHSISSEDKTFKESFKSYSEDKTITADSGESEKSWQEGNIIKRRYEIPKVMAGGMGEVYIAFDRELGRMVAIKTPLEKVFSSNDGRARFYREADIWISLGIHPNICTAYYIQEMGNIPRLFIEYINGGNLETYLKSNSAINMEKKLDIAIQIAEGMNHAHTFLWKDENNKEEKGLVHRDLKPANILMTEDGTSKITDFGLVGKNRSQEEGGSILSKITKIFGFGKKEEKVEIISPNNETDNIWHTMTMAGGVMGTPPYMAPEQWESAADKTSDIYAYGCILYEIFCSELPFKLNKEYIHAIAMVKINQWKKMHLTDSPADPQTLNNNITKELSLLMLKCLDKKPSKRPGDFEEIIKNLKTIYENITAKPYGKLRPKASKLMAGSLNNQGVSYMTIGQSEKAKDLWRKALKADPGHLEANFNLALYEVIYQGINPDEAFRKVDSIKNISQPGHIDHLTGKLLIFGGDAFNAIKRLKEAAGKEDARGEVFRDLAIAQGIPGFFANFKEAAENFKKAMDKGTEDIYTITGYCLALKKIGQEEEGKRFYENHRNKYTLPYFTEEAGNKYMPGYETIRDIDSKLLNVSSIDMSNDGNVLLLGGYNNGSYYNLMYGETGIIFKTLQVPNKIGYLSGSEGYDRKLAMDYERKYVISAGRELVNESDDRHNIFLISLDNGNIIKTFKGHDKEVNCVLINDGNQFFSGGEDKKIIMWDISGGRILKIFQGHTEGIMALKISSDRQFLISGSKDKTIRLWDINSGREIKSFKHTGRVISVNISPDGKYLLSSDSSGIVRLWDIKKDESLISMRFRGDHVAFSSDGKAIICKNDTKISIWDLEGKLCNIYSPGPNCDVKKFLLHPDGERIITVNHDKISYIKIFRETRYPIPLVLSNPLTSGEAEKKEAQFEEKLNNAKELLKDKKYNKLITLINEMRTISGHERDSSVLELAGQTNYFPRVKLLNSWEVKSLRRDNSNITDVKFTPDGRKIVCLSFDDRTIEIRDMETEKTTIIGQNTEKLRSIDIDPEGKYVISAGFDTNIKLWDLKGNLIHTFTGHTEEVNKVKFSPDGRYIVSGSKDKSVRLWSVTDKTCVLSFSHDATVNTVDYGHDGKYIVSGSMAEVYGIKDNSVRIWDIGGKKPITVIKRDSSVMAVAFTPDGKYVISSETNKLLLWDMKGVLISEMNTEMLIRTIKVSPDSRYIVAGGDNQKLYFFDIEKKELIFSMTAHNNWIRAVDFSSDGNYIVSCGGENAVNIWYLDWQREFREETLWDEEIRPYLKNFLGEKYSFNIQKNKKELVKSKDVNLFLKQVSSIGYGWIKAEGIKKELEIMEKEIKSGQSEEQKNHELFKRKMSEGKVFLSKKNPNQALQSIQTARSISGYFKNEEAIELCRKIMKEFPHKKIKDIWEERKFSVKGITADIAISPDGTFIMTAVADKIYIWERDKQNNPEIFNGHNNIITSIVPFPQWDYIITASSQEQRINIWDMKTGKIAYKISDAGYVNYGTFIPGDKKHILACSQEELIKWNINTGKAVIKIKTPAYLFKVTVSADGKYGLTIGNEQNLRLWNINTGEALKVFEKSRLYNSATINPEGNEIIAANDTLSNMGEINAIDVTTGKETRAFKGHNNTARAIKISSDGKYMVSGNNDNIRIWDYNTGECLKIIEDTPAHYLSISDDLSYIASADEQGNIRLFYVDWYQSEK